MSRRNTRGGDAPLLAWGEQLRARKAAQRRIIRRLAIGGVGLAVVSLTIVWPPIPRLVWNASPSAPMGLYAVEPDAEIRRGDMVIARLSEPWRTLAARRHYLPANVPLVKHVAAGDGDRVRASGDRLIVNGQLIARRRSSDAKGRFLPRWEGSLTLGKGQYLLLMDRPNSFDGRYFGPVAQRNIIGRAVLLWRW